MNPRTEAEHDLDSSSPAATAAEPRTAPAPSDRAREVGELPEAPTAERLSLDPMRATDRYRLVLPLDLRR